MFIKEGGPALMRWHSVWSRSLNFDWGYPGNFAERSRKKDWWHLEIWGNQLGTQLTYLLGVSACFSTIFSFWSLIYKLIHVLQFMELKWSNEHGCSWNTSRVLFCLFVSVPVLLSIRKGKVKWEGAEVSTLEGGVQWPCFFTLHMALICYSRPSIIESQSVDPSNYRFKLFGKQISSILNMHKHLPFLLY